MNIRFAAFLAAIAAAAVSTADALPRVHPGVHRTLRQQGFVNLIVILADTTESTLESIQESEYATRTDRINALKSKLEAGNKKASLEVEAALAKEVSGAFGSYKNFWISNQLFIDSASFDLVEKLAGLSSVAEIREERSFPVFKPILEAEDTNELVGQEWGVKKIGAPKVWADGNIGQGVVVGTIDTGVLGTHEALKRNFLGAYGWFDPEAKKPEPYDGNGHGTHTMGTIVGVKGVGVAPGAKWLACKGCRTEDCPESDLLDCAQFILCPTLTDGSASDCSKAPQVVSNSWGGGQSDNWYKPAVDAWIKAGIVPVFAQGNEGPACTTASSPGDYPNVIGVGATTSVDKLASFSSKGPTVNGRRKPDISAPGQSVRSSWNSADNGYRSISGTSMATPHVAGAVALLLSAQPDLAIDEIKVALYTTTDQVGLGSTNYTCGGTSDKNWPNNQFGHGRLNVFNAYEGFRPAA
uniref:subtilisin n=1 Tax=Globisporangium ultimum (strain ATCC 200006 / CBS 805.95 / DAOM BR144) TaxID=431595 RepID=K3WF12_GLOUD